MLRAPLFFTAIFILAAIQAVEASQLKIVLRYDDYSRSSNADVEQALFDVARDIGGGVLVGVIPFPGSPYPAIGSQELPLGVDLDDKKLDLLKGYASQGNIEIEIHGYSHRSNAGDGPNSEFSGLPENTQTFLLSTAKDSLEAAVGCEIASFVPPFNQYDNHTLKALESSGYKLLSASIGGPTLRNGKLSYLPGGAYPQRLKDVVLSALSKNHTDAIIISTLHPYDFVESGTEMADFRRASPQISIQKLIEDLRQINQLKDVRFVSVRSLFASNEDLSPDRLSANLKLKESVVTRHRLLPEAFNLYPLTGLYYSQESANRMYVLQIVTFWLLYVSLALLVTLISRIAVTHFRVSSKNITVLAGLSVAGIFVLLVKSVFGGFYMTSAIGVVCCLSLLSGIVLKRWRTAP